MKKGDLSQLKSKLMRYSKEDIVDVILSQYQGDYYARIYLLELNDRLFKRSIDREQKAFDKNAEAFEAYIQWTNELKAKYGKDGKINLNSLTDYELKKTSMLLEKLKKSENECNKARNQVDDVFWRNKA